MDEVPTRENDMKWVGMSIAVFYTVWSYKPGAGRQIVNGVAGRIKTQRPWVKRFVTLSPLTEMAEKFHLKNGAQATVLSAKVQNPFGYGRIIRDSKNEFKAIVEEKDTTDIQKKLNEINY